MTEHSNDKNALTLKMVVRNIVNAIPEVSYISHFAEA